MKPPFRKRMLKGELLIGTIVSLPCPPIAELFARCGFDWLFVDSEHGPLCLSDIQLLLQAGQPHCPCVIRVATNDEVHIKQALDLGADGIIAPLVNDADTAARVVELTKYPPLGKRSVGIARAQGYGSTFGAYVAQANETVAVIVQIEHIDAAANIASILNVTGIDGVFIGPYDLSASMGKPGKIHDDEVQQEIEAVRQACLKQRMPLGIFGVDVSALQGFVGKGYTLIAAGMDTLLLNQSARNLLSELKPGISPWRH